VPTRLSLKLALGALVLGTAAPAAVARADGPFFCAGERHERAWTYPALDTGGPPGTLELALLAPPAERRGGEQPGLLSARFSIAAKNARVFDVAASLSDKLHLTVSASPAVADARITLRASDIDLDRLRRLLGTIFGIEITVLADRVVFQTLREADELAAAVRRASQQSEPLKVRVIAARHLGASLDALAALLCRELSSERGSVTAYANTLVVKDTLGPLDRVTALVTALDRLPASSAKAAKEAFSCSPPKDERKPEGPASAKADRPTGKLAIKLLPPLAPAASERAPEGIPVSWTTTQLSVLSDGASLRDVLASLPRAPLDFVVGPGVESSLFLASPGTSLAGLLRDLPCRPSDGFLVCESREEQERKQAEARAASATRRRAMILTPEPAMPAANAARLVCGPNPETRSAAVIGSYVVILDDPEGLARAQGLVAKLSGKPAVGAVPVKLDPEDEPASAPDAATP
jgi:hypothetical protein